MTILLKFLWELLGADAQPGHSCAFGCTAPSCNALRSLLAELRFLCRALDYSHRKVWRSYGAALAGYCVPGGHLAHLARSVLCLLPPLEVCFSPQACRDTVVAATCPVRRLIRHQGQTEPFELLFGHSPR